MWISDFSITRPVITTVVMLALVTFGTLALFVLDTDEFPEIDPPVIALSVPYPGASPETVERELVEPLEDAITAISGVDRITSTSLDGFALLIVEFVFEKDLQEASQDIRDRISEVRAELPLEIEEPTLTRFDPANLPIVSLALTSAKLGPAELTRLADPGITSALRSVQGVADVRVLGGVERELVIELHPAALDAVGVSVDDVVQAVQAQSLAAPVGRVIQGNTEQTIRLQGRLEEPREFEDLLIPGTPPVRLGQVATVRDGAEEPRSGAQFNGRTAVGIDVVKATEFSTTDVSERVLARVRELEGTLPEGVALTVVRDAGVRVARSVADVQRSLLEGAALTVAVVFLFLSSWRSTVITGLALPVSVLASFIAVWAFGFTLNTMSLLGLSLAIGILIDDAIVVRENIVRHMELGKDHVRAAHDGTSEIGLAVAATTFSIVVVFVPIAFMGGIAQQWFAPFALTIASSVLVSLFVSFSLDPMLSAHWPDPEVHGKKGFVTRATLRFNAWFDRQVDRYRRTIRWALRHRLTMGLLALGSFVAALAAPATGLLGSEFFPEQDLSEVYVSLESPPGASLEYTLEKSRQASDLIRRIEGVDYTYTTVGGQTQEEIDQALIYVRLLPRAERRLHQTEITKQIRTALSRMAGVDPSIATTGFGSEKQIQIEITGPDLDTLNRLAEEVAAEVRRVPGAGDVGLSSRGQRPELVVDIDRELAADLGVTVQQVAQALRPAFAGVDAGDWVDPQGETRDVTVRLAPEARQRRADLERLPIRLDENLVVPLEQVAEVREELGPNQIQHLDRRRVVQVEANTVDRALNAVVTDINARIAELALPPGYEIGQGGEAEDQREVFARILLALAVAVLLMYIVLVIQFGSFTDPIPIMASLPLSLIGVVLGLLVTGSTLNLMSMIGVILLMGIVAKNAILLIDFAKWTQERRALDRKSAIIEAGGVRLRPIVMTSVAIVAGMLPVAIGHGEGADFRAPLGRAVIGGVITSTLLTLLVIPTFYDVLSSLRDRALRALRRRLHARARPDLREPPESVPEAE
ncbi:MAG TPA: efflux RND transporter permease subunit [Polyangiaceae bacterium]|nr:efflux RND transporter permease subunit [Polyangiaceae bacterium]